MALRPRKKNATPLNIMVVGREGVGKSTFLRTLVYSLALGGSVDAAQATPKPASEGSPIVVHHPVEVDMAGSRIALTLIDTPGLPYSTDQGTELGTIMSYIESQFETCLIEELKVKRNPKFSDTMVHTILYLLPPMLPFHPVDLSAIRTLSNRANVVPLLAHADSITNRQLASLKASLLQTLREHLNLLDFVNQDLDGDGIVEDAEEEEYVKEMAVLKDALPFTVIGAEFPGDTEHGGPADDPSAAYLDVNGKQILGREYKWGIVDVNNRDHCELHYVKYLLFEFSLPSLRSFTKNVMYERYRTERLMQHAGKADPAASNGAREE